MVISDDEDESLAQFLESEVLAFSNQDEWKQLEVEDDNDKFGAEEDHVTEKLRDVKDEGKEAARRRRRKIEEQSG